MRLLDGLPGRRLRPARPLLSITRGGATWEALAARSTGGVLRAGAAVRRAPSLGNGSSKAASWRAPRAEPPHTRQRRREPRSPRPRKPKQTRLLGHDCGGLLSTAHGSPESEAQCASPGLRTTTGGQSWKHDVPYRASRRPTRFSRGHGPPATCRRRVNQLPLSFRGLDLHVSRSVLHVERRFGTRTRRFGRRTFLFACFCIFHK